MVSWYPTLKLISIILSCSVIWWLVKKEMWRLLGGFVIFVSLVIFMNPFHVDGTNSTSYDKIVNQTTKNKYEYDSQLPKIEIHRQTFSERMEKIDERNEIKNAKIQTDLTGDEK